MGNSSGVASKIVTPKTWRIPQFPITELRRTEQGSVVLGPAFGESALPEFR